MTVDKGHNSDRICFVVTIGQCYRVTYRSQDMPRNMLPLGDTILRVNPSKRARLLCICLSRL